MNDSIRVKALDLRPGDYLSDLETHVESVWNDPEGIWLETSDGEVGYVRYVNAKYTVERF